MLYYMSSQQRKTAATSSLIQLLVGFIVPTIILLTMSGNDRLGPLGAMLLALVFPVALELYGLTRRRKPSLMSIAAIIGILLIGLISVLGLSKDWLALRRSALYTVGAIVLFVIVRFKPTLIEKGLDRVLEMEGIRTASRKNKTEAQLMRYTVKAGYVFALILLIIAAASYILTILFITAPTGSSEFNAQYAELRILSIFVITAPFIIAVTGVFVYLINKFEKLTGIRAEDLIKKRQ